MHRPRDTESYVEAAHRRVVIYDGATGTWLQQQNLTADDCRGPSSSGCNEYRRDPTRRHRTFHREYCELGVDVIETNTFACSPSAGEYGLADRDREISQRQRLPSLRMCRQYGHLGRRESIGPVIPNSRRRPDHLRRTAHAYHQQGLACSTVASTCLDRDTVRPARHQGGRRGMPSGHGLRPAAMLPLQLQVTIELNGRIVPGTDPGALRDRTVASRRHRQSMARPSGEYERHLRVLSQQ